MAVSKQCAITTDLAFTRKHHLLYLDVAACTVGVELMRCLRCWGMALVPPPPDVTWYRRRWDSCSSAYTLDLLFSTARRRQWGEDFDPRTTALDPNPTAPACREGELATDAAAGYGWWKATTAGEGRGHEGLRGWYTCLGSYCDDAGIAPSRRRDWRWRWGWEWGWGVGWMMQRWISGRWFHRADWRMEKWWIEAERVEAARVGSGGGDAGRGRPSDGGERGMRGGRGRRRRSAGGSSGGARRIGAWWQRQQKRWGGARVPRVQRTLIARGGGSGRIGEMADGRSGSGKTQMNGSDWFGWFHQ